MFGVRACGLAIARLRLNIESRIIHILARYIQNRKLVIRFEVRSFFSHGYSFSEIQPCTSLFRPSCTVPRMTGLTRVYCVYICMPPTKACTN